MQENVTIKTTGGHEVVIKPFITGREAVSLGDITAETVEKRNVAILHKTIEIMVVSVDGKKENCLSDVLDLPFKEYMEVNEKVQEMSTGKKKEKAG